jgi:hypothetical protein
MALETIALPVELGTLGEPLVSEGSHISARLFIRRAEQLPALDFYRAEALRQWQPLDSNRYLP